MNIKYIEIWIHGKYWMLLSLSSQNSKKGLWLCLGNYWSLSTEYLQVYIAKLGCSYIEHPKFITTRKVSVNIKIDNSAWVITSVLYSYECIKQTSC